MLYEVITIQPGSGLGKTVQALPPLPEVQSKPLSDTLLEIVPDNIFEALTQNEAMLSVIFFSLLAGIYIRNNFV